MTGNTTQKTPLPLNLPVLPEAPTTACPESRGLWEQDMDYPNHLAHVPEREPLLEEKSLWTQREHLRARVIDPPHYLKSQSRGRSVLLF